MRGAADAHERSGTLLALPVSGAAAAPAPSGRGGRAPCYDAEHG